MRCERCGSRDQPGPRCCGYCGAVLAGSGRLGWDDPALAVGSDPPLRRRYRLLQSWYRERVLDADHGYDHRRGTRPVGSLLGEWEVVADQALNFLGDHVVLDYVSPLAVPVLVMLGREAVPQGAVDDELLLEAEPLAGTAMRVEGLAEGLEED